MSVKGENMPSLPDGVVTASTSRGQRGHANQPNLDLSTLESFAEMQTYNARRKNPEIVDLLSDFFISETVLETRSRLG